ncbi:hypothetical protein DXG03_002954 [Asterophora parasitica]|uniref:Uncharacterized protein n=1 Tax=Asterophora parasitica TaxID=117018 RepID=A0A9P7G8C5_9AGAR|nr:hypothetical protein DXG03_002954 [Asterophora parasitica]
MPGLDSRSIHKLDILLKHRKDQAPFNDSSIEKIFDKFNTRFQKLFAKEIQRIDSEKYMDEKEFLEIYTFINVDPLEESIGREEGVFVPSRSQSLVSSLDDEHRRGGPSSSDGDRTSSPTPSPRKQGKAKSTSSARPPRKRTATPPSSEEDDDDEEENVMATPVPTTATPKRRGVKRLLVHTPGSEAPTSPLFRKKSRVKSPQKSRNNRKGGATTDDSDSDVAVTRAVSVVSENDAESEQEVVDEASEESDVEVDKELLYAEDDE